MGTLRVGVEVPKYEVLYKGIGGIEIRKYAPCVSAAYSAEGETELNGSGFRPLARYIGAFGTPENYGNIPIKMTAPVTTEMTASNAYTMRFLLPSSWTSKTPPEPVKDSGVVVEQIPARIVAVKYFSGSCRTAEVVDAQEKAVRDALPMTTEDGVVYDAIKGDAGRRELARYKYVLSTTATLHTQLFLHST